MIDQINSVLALLQMRGRSSTRVAIGRPALEQFEWVTPAGWPGTIKQGSSSILDSISKAEYVSEPFSVLEKDSRAFTLWWGDGEGAYRYDEAMKLINESRACNTNPLLIGPAPDMIRVRVQVDVTPDYATITFYIDVSKSWNCKAIFLGRTNKPICMRQSTMPDTETIAPSKISEDCTYVWGERRWRIYEAVRQVRQISEGRLDPAIVSRPILPEDGSIDGANAQTLQDAADLLYSGVWCEFEKAFGLTIPTIAGEACEVFSNFRGLVIGTPGVTEDQILKLRGGCAALQTYNVQIGRQEPDGSRNAVVTPAPPSDNCITADSWESRQKLENVGSIGFERQPHFKGYGSGIGKPGDDDFVPNEAHVVAKAFWPFVRRTVSDFDYKEYLLCGVFNFRGLYITALGSRSELDEGDEWAYDEIANLTADLPHLRRAPPDKDKDPKEEPVSFLLITKMQPPRRQLSRIIERINAMNTVRLMALKDWDVLTNADLQVRLRGEELDSVLDWFTSENEKYRPKFYNPQTGDYDDEIGRQLGKSAYETGMELDKLGTAINKIGEYAVGGLPYRINRSRMHSAEFEVLAKSLGVGNVDTWIAYDQYVDRNVRPLFNLVDGLGQRLVSFRQRLQSAVELVQATALVLQMSATRLNTDFLRQIENENEQRLKIEERRERNNRRFAVLLALLAVVVGLGSIGDSIKAKLPGLRFVFDMLKDNSGDLIAAAVIIGLALAGWWLLEGRSRAGSTPSNNKN